MLFQPFQIDMHAYVRECTWNLFSNVNYKTIQENVLQYTAILYFIIISHPLMTG